MQRFLFYDYKNKSFDGRLISQCGANPLAVIFMRASYWSAPMCIGLRVEQNGSSAAFPQTW